MSAIGGTRGNIYITKDQGYIEPDRSGEAILKPMYGTNMFASQAGSSPMGGVRSNVPRVQYKEEWNCGTDRETETILPMQAGSNKFASQSGSGGMGGKRNQVPMIQGRLPHDRKAHGIIPYQAGSNLYASQVGMIGAPGVGAYRQATTEIEALDMTEEDLRKGALYTPWFAGTNQYASQTGTGGFLKHRDIKSKPKYGQKEIPEEQQRKSESLLPLQSGTNKLASQKGMTGFGMVRDVYVKPKWKQQWVQQWEAAEKEWEESGRGKLVDQQKWERERQTVSRMKSVASVDNVSVSDDDADQEASYSLSLREEAT